MNTRARIATIAQGQQFFRETEKNVSRMLELVDAALRQSPDMICLPERFDTVSVPFESAAEIAEPVTGPTVAQFAERARRGRCYVICPILTTQNGIVYNSAVVLDRDGEIVGVYNKRNVVTSASDYTVLENGVAPGGAPDGDTDGVFDLDFGRVGVRICFDVGFPEDWESLARRDVRLVFWPSAYDGGNKLNVYAALHNVYVVTSVRSERSRVINPCGEEIAQTDRYQPIAICDINLDYAVCHYDFNAAIPERILADYAGRVAIRSHARDGLFLVEPADPSVTIAGLQARYGFETIAQYHQRHRDAYAAIRSEGIARPQQAAHGNRPVYGKG